jgi:hypothetical protein
MSGARHDGEVEHYHNNNFEEQVPFDSTQNPQRRKRKRKAHKKHTQGIKEQHYYVKGRLNNMDSSSIHGEMKVVGGYIQIGSVQVFALFDPSASHSFISAKWVESNEVMKCLTRRPLMVYTPMGEIPADQVCPGVSLIINKEEFTATFMVLESLKNPVVFGNGWLCAQKAVIQVNQNTVLLTAPSGERIEYMGIPPPPKEHEPGLLKDDGSKTQGVQDQCQCCKLNEVPCLQNKSNKEEDNVNNLDMNPSQIKPDNKEFQVCQAKAMPNEVCIDGWTITYKEFQPQRAKRAKKQVDTASSNKSVEDLAKIRCFRCQQEGHYAYFCPQKKQPPSHG